VVAEIKNSGGQSVAIQADLSKSADIRRLFEESKRAFGTLDVLVNNGGTVRPHPLP
jgi:3-oxoacyl-[acyl-carrier protein] reductase